MVTASACGSEYLCMIEMTYEHGFRICEHGIGINEYLNMLLVWFEIYLQVVWITVRIVQGDLSEQRYRRSTLSRIIIIQ